jgi:CBS domain containing-hemolysin-like protein
MSTVAQLVAALALVAANGFFVAAEFALTRLRPTQVAELERAGLRRARTVRHAVEHVDAYLAACQLGITLASIGLGVVGEPAFAALLEPLLGDGASIAGIGIAAALAFALITLLHVVLGELAPKSVAISRTTGTMLALAAPLRLFYLATRPVVDAFNALGNLALRPFGIPPAREAGHAPHSENELRTLLRDSSRHGLIDQDEGRLGENALTFGDRPARSVMRPRSQIIAVPATATVVAASERALAHGYSRLPVYDPDSGLDAPLGVVHLTDLLDALLRHPDVQVGQLAHPPAIVRPDARIDSVMRRLLVRHQHMALVADARGTTHGLITLEDILEEIVGEIDDESDRRRPSLTSAVRATHRSARTPASSREGRWGDPRPTNAAFSP